MTQWLFFLGAVISLILLTKNVLNIMLALDNYSMHKKRLQQLQFNNKKLSSNEEQTKELIDKVTTPIISMILPKLKIKDFEQIEKDLKIVGWDKYFTGKQFVALNILSKILAVAVFLLLSMESAFLGLIWAIPLFFVCGYWLESHVSEKREKFLFEFPEFIRIVQGYLTAGLIFEDAVEQAIPFVGKEWRPVLEKFVSNCMLTSKEKAMEELQEEVDLFEVREFMSIVRLSMEQGINVSESFNKQIDKVKDLKYEVMMTKIAKREILGTSLQLPLLLTMIVGATLPVLSSMMNFSSI